MPNSAAQDALGQQLGVACSQGQLDRVQRLLAAGAAKEIPTPVMGMAMTPLNAAAYTNNVRSKPHRSNCACVCMLESQIAPNVCIIVQF